MMSKNVTRVKVIANASKEEFEQEVNDFLEKLGSKPDDIQYQKSEGMFSAMIIYGGAT